MTVPPSLVLAAALGVASTAPATETARPARVIVIQADDLGYGDLGFTGNTRVRTPHIDRLAAQSLRVLDFTVNPVCAPSRATLLTGRHFLRTGVSHVHGGRDFLDRGERTLAEVFREQGWSTGLWGKWHLGTGPGYEPWERGFEVAERLRLYRHANAILTTREGETPTQQWADTVIFERAQAFLEERAGRPTFVYLPTMTPHSPLAAPEAFVAPYRAEGLSEPLAQLYGMVSALDHEVGRLVSFLEQRGWREDTLILFTSDNGPAINQGLLSDEDRRIRGVGGLRGWKGDIWQGGVRVPLLVSWPRGVQPGEFRQPIDQADVFPTLLAWCGIDHTPPRPLDGIDRSAVLRGPGGVPEADRPIFNYADPGWLTGPRAYDPRGIAGEYAPLTRADVAALRPEHQPISVREGRFKLLWNPTQVADGSPSGETVLFDLVLDPGETTDIADRHPEIHARLGQQLRTWFASIQAEPGAFGHAVNVVRALPASIRADRPARLAGDLENSVTGLFGWRQPGARATYAVEAPVERRAAASLRWHAPPPPGLRLRLGGAGEAVTDGTAVTTFPVIVLPEGASDLTLELVETPVTGSEELRLLEIVLEEPVSSL